MVDSANLSFCLQSYDRYLVSSGAKESFFAAYKNFVYQYGFLTISECNAVSMQEYISH